jgi:hypothetical protein
VVFLWQYVRLKKTLFVYGRSVADCWGWLLGRYQNFDGFGLFGDSSRLFRESVDKGAALFIDPELNSPCRRAHDVK